MKTERLGAVNVRIGEPAVVALSEPGETRWGYHQFPALSRLPDGSLMTTFNDRPDHDTAYGTPGPALLSRDEGRTWTPWTPPDPLLAVSHSVVSELDGGEYLFAPMSQALDIVANGLNLPPPAARMDVYGEVLFYRLAECPDAVRSFVARVPALRWHPAEGAWRREDMGWDTADALVRKRADGRVIPRPYLDSPLLKWNGALLFADYHLQRRLPDGGFPQKYACWCMVSRDNGRTWQRGGLIAHDPDGDAIMGEPCLMPTADGALACLIRCTDQRQRPMRIAYSADGGDTWSAPEHFHAFGVMPQGLLLENGVGVASFGRPGVHLKFSADDRARAWTAPLSLVRGNDAAVTADSCGYTRMMPVAPDAFLIVYSDFSRAYADGLRRKAILACRVEVRRA